jgi:hypothetical protein
MQAAHLMASPLVERRPSQPEDQKIGDDEHAQRHLDALHQAHEILAGRSIALPSLEHLKALYISRTFWQQRALEAAAILADHEGDARAVVDHHVRNLAALRERAAQEIPPRV